MGAAAQFDGVRLGMLRVFAHGQHPYFITIFFAEQGFGARGNRLVGGQQAGRGIRILPDHFVDLHFHARNFFPPSSAWDG